MPSLILTRPSGESPGNVIAADSFGANFMFDKHLGDRAEAFDAACRATGTGLLRYPGGARAEHCFDVRNPDATSHDEFHDQLPLSQFMQDAGASGRGVIITLPTHCFGRAGMSNSYGSQDLARFIKTCLDLADAHGVRIKAFELGNEYWDENLSWAGDCEAAYGRTAAQMALVVNGVLDQSMHSAAVQPEIWMQCAGRIADPAARMENNATIIRAFTSIPGAINAIDGLVDHYYGQRFDSGGGFNARGVWDAWAQARGGAAPRLTINYSEWNVHSADKSEEDGLRQAGFLVKIFHGLMSAGRADSLQVFNLLGGNDNPLTHWRDGSLLAGGEAFHMLSESTRGTRAVETGQVAGFEVDSFLREGDRLVVFVTNRNADTATLELDPGLVGTGYHHVWARSVDVRPGEARDDPYAELLILGQSYGALNRDGDAALELTLDPYEVMRLVFTIGKHGVLLTGHTENEALSGSAYGDTIWAGGGDDWLTGGAGDDVLVGGLGDGDMAIYGGTASVTVSLAQGLTAGGQGRDSLSGIEHVLTGQGADVLMGDTAANRLHGGAGNDTISGASGTDTLIGGQGTDLLRGGRDGVADQFVFADVADSRAGGARDVIEDFVSGIDRISLAGLDANPWVAGDQPFAFSARAAACSVWQVRSGDDLILRADVTGDLTPDFELRLTGVAGITVDDLIL